MKKLLLFASALLAFSFFGCTQQSSLDISKSDAVVDSDDNSTGEEELQPQKKNLQRNH